VLDAPGEITAAQPVASIPFSGEAGVQYRAIVNGIPAGSTDFILTLKDPAGNILQQIDTATSPEVVTQVFPTTGTFTYEVSGFQGDLGDYTFQIQEVISAAVVLTTREWGHEGGNQVEAEFLNPGAADQPLSVAVTDKLISVSLGTDSSGALNSTAEQVVDAINASPAASAVVMATTFRGNRGVGIAQARARTFLSDFLNAPASVARGPFQQRLYRIGAHRDGSKVGVFLFCQQHAREWTTSLTCLETAHQLVE
jgi:hypothetical protein